MIQGELDEDIALAGAGGSWLVLERLPRGRGGHAGREHVLEKGLPDDVGRIADDAEEGELEDGREAKGEGSLGW